MADPSPKIPLWLDCDPGHDDAFALVLSLYHPRIHLLGVSTVHGNASLASTTANALSLLTAFGRPDVPVYPGAAKPFCRGAVHAEDIHGKTGLDGTSLLPTPTSAAKTEKSAILAMRDALLAQELGTAWVVATGTLTNVALLFAVFPELVAHIGGLSIMGGAIGGGFTDAPMGKVDGDGVWRGRVGNWSEWAEFNVYCDPESAHSLLSNPALAAKTTLIPLDLTHQVLATQTVLDSLLHPSPHPSPSPPSNHHSPQDINPPSPPSPLRTMLHSLLSFFAHTYATVFGITQGPPLHDPLAVAVILDVLGVEEFGFSDTSHSLDAPDSSDSSNPSESSGSSGSSESGAGVHVRYEVQVITDGAHALLVEDREGEEGGKNEVGRTVVVREVRGGKGKGGGGVRIPRGIRKVERFWEVLFECVARAEEGTRGKGVWEGW